MDHDPRSKYLVQVHFLEGSFLVQVHDQVKHQSHFGCTSSLIGGELSPLARLFTLLLLLPLLELHLVRPPHQRWLLLQPEAPRYVPQVELLHHENLLQFTSVGSVGANPGTESVPGKLLCSILEKN